MFHLAEKIFIKDKDPYKEKVRFAYGTLCALLCIFGNILCVLFKLILGFYAHSMSVIADGLNNLSDVGSNIASLVGFKIAAKHPDEKHPFGHGRAEYVVGEVIGIIILLIGYTSLKESIQLIIHPSKMVFSIITLIALFISIGIKIWMYRFNTYAGNYTHSQTLIAVGKDSLNDVLTTFAAIIALVFSPYTTIPIDGIMGVIVSIIILLNGFTTIKEMTASLLGEIPDKAFQEELIQLIENYDYVLGVHDFMMHDYGPGRRFLVVHVEMPYDLTLEMAHSIVDEIEREIKQKYQIETTIHIDPYNFDKESNQARKLVETIITNINKEYSMHDFQLNKQKESISFDVYIPPNDHISELIIEEKLQSIIKLNYPEYDIKINFDHHET